MNTLIQHANIVIKMYNNNIDRGFIKKFSINEIINCCNSIEKSKLESDAYKDNLIIQEELIRDEKFIKYLKVAYKRKYDMSTFENLLEQIKNHNEKMSDYPLKQIFSVLDNRKLCSKAYYDFLKYYINESFYIRKVVTENLNYFYTQSNRKFFELTENERNLLKSNYLNNYNLIPNDTIKEVYQILVNNEELRNFIEYLDTKKLYIPLKLKNYEQINKNAKEITIHIRKIVDKVQNDEIVYKILLNWVKNDCSLYDLKVIKEKINNIESGRLEDIFSNRTGYINFIYGNKLKKFPLENISGCREEIIIYAIREDKKSFLNLIENNIESFLSIPINSLLYCENFYTKFVNLNEITLKQLEKLKTMYYDSYSYIDDLKDQNFTFEEIATLYNVKKQYIQIYNELLSLKTDDRLLRIRQLLKKNLLDYITNDIEIMKIAEKIKEKPLYIWLENDFNKIENIKIDDVIQILIHYENVKKFLPDIKNNIELSYILRNNEKIMKYDSLKNIKENIENMDEYWIKLKNDMKFSDDFLQKYSNNIKEFLLNDGSELAYTYYINRNEAEKEAFKLIIKAQLMGEFKKLKYHIDDLSREIDYELKSYQIKEWTEHNATIIDGKYNIREYDDFYHTMILGEYPKRTCLSYKGGAYNDCLLACFDSNKKILYAKINNNIVARAMVRLTKGKDNNLKSLSFVDVEDDSQANKVNYEEKLTLFLERPYISGISKTDERNIKKLFIKLLKTKAKQMNALLVLNNYYNDGIDEQFVSTTYYMYISKSKSSSQYLDSLSGEATISDEGQYKANTFLIWKPPVEKEQTLFFESIFAA